MVISFCTLVGFDYSDLILTDIPFWLISVFAELIVNHVMVTWVVISACSDVTWTVREFHLIT